MRRYTLRLDKYGISAERFRELDGFCRQYKAYKARLADMLHSSAAPPNGQPRGNTISDPVGALAAQRDALMRKCEMIEQAAIEASAELYQYIIRAVTGDPAHNTFDVPCGHNQFDQARRLFYVFLDRRKVG